MKTFYCVVSSYDDFGLVSAIIVDTKVCNDCPESTFTRERTKDIYTDWFDSLEKAKKAVRDAQNA